MRSDDLVILVPGFMGFSRVGGFYYFADRVAAALRGALEGSFGRTVPVVPACTLPADHLAARQHKLMAEIEALVGRVGEVSRIHLVGHSAGGVDAQLLTCDQPLDSDRWSSAAERIRAKIRTVVTIAAPHHGTSLADAELATFLVDPVRSYRSMPSVALPMFNFARLVAADTTRQAVLSYMATNLPESARFVAQLALHRGLIQDLSPRSMAAIRANCRCSKKPFTRCFVTAVPLMESADPFFKELRALTEAPQACVGDSTVVRAVKTLSNGIDKLIRHGGPAITFSAQTSDGVVNSARQLLEPDDADQLGGIVVGDHADVIGHYDRVDALAGNEVLNLGLFHSGAAFGDNQFFELYRRVAGAILESVRQS